MRNLIFPFFVGEFISRMINRRSMKYPKDLSNIYMLRIAKFGVCNVYRLRIIQDFPNSE